MQSWALAEHIAFRPAPFLPSLYDPALEGHSGDTIDPATRNHLKDRSQRWLGQSDCALLLRFNNEQMSGVISGLCKHIQAVPASVWFSDGHGTPFAHEEQYNA